MLYQMVDMSIDLYPTSLINLYFPHILYNIHMIDYVEDKKKEDIFIFEELKKIFSKKSKMNNKVRTEYFNIDYEKYILTKHKIKNANYLRIYVIRNKRINIKHKICILLVLIKGKGLLYDFIDFSEESNKKFMFDILINKCKERGINKIYIEDLINLTTPDDSLDYDDRYNYIYMSNYMVKNKMHYYEKELKFENIQSIYDNLGKEKKRYEHFKNIKSEEERMKYIKKVDLNQLYFMLELS